MLSEDVQEKIKTTSRTVFLETMRQILSTLRFKNYKANRESFTALSGSKPIHQAVGSRNADFGKMTEKEQEKYSPSVKSSVAKSESKGSKSIAINPIVEKAVSSGSISGTPTVVRVTPEYVKEKYTKLAEELNALRETRKEVSITRNDLMR